MTNRRVLQFAGSIAVLSAAAACTQVHAQPISGAAEGAAVQELEEIVVTSRRVEESLQRVPISVTAFSAEALEERSVKTIVDVAAFSPNVSIVKGSGSGATGGGGLTASFSIRGIGGSAEVTAEPGVGIYIDDVYMARSLGTNLDIADLSRVEVLRGPQGTLFGKNTLGGAISLYSALPTGDFRGYGEVSYGRFNERAFKGSVEFPLSDTFAAKVSVLYRKRDGYSPSLISGKKLDDIDTMGARAILRWTPRADFSATVISDISRARQNGQANHILALSQAALNGPGPAGIYQRLVATPSVFGPLDSRYISAGQLSTYSTGPQINDLDVMGHVLKAEWSITASLTLTSISAWRRQKGFIGQDPDGSPHNIQANTIIQKADQLSEELRLTGVHFDDRLQWTAGFMYFKSTADDFNRVRAFTPQLYQITRIPGFDITNNQQVKPENTEVAGFLHATYELTDKLKVTGGIRYSNETKDIYIASVKEVSGVVVIPPTTRHAVFRAWTPKASAEYQFTDDVMAYVSVAKGYRSGGYTYAASNAANFQPYNPEKAWTYEVGIKSQWLDNRLRLNAAAFYNDYTDYQVSAMVQPGEGSCPSTEVQTCNLVVNGAKVRITGAEVEATAVVTSNFQVNGSIGYTDSGFTRVDPRVTQVNLNTVLPNVSRYVYSVGALYSAPLEGVGVMQLRADYSYRSEYYLSINNSPVLRQDDFGLINLRAALISEDERWELAVSGKNLTDERYLTSGLDQSNITGYIVGAYAEPKTWTISAKYRF